MGRAVFEIHTKEYNIPVGMILKVTIISEIQRNIAALQV